MSGFEIAGVVLGAFPILCDGVKDMRAVLKDLKDWWTFQTEFEKFIASVDREYIAYTQILEILLSPLDIVEEERDRMLSYPCCDLWSSPAIQKQLRQRIKIPYWEWFMEQLGEMNNAIEELHHMLPVNKAYHLDSTSLESELFRLRTSFGHRKDDLLATIADKNEQLYKFLDRASQVKPSAGSMREAKSAQLLDLQRNARTLSGYLVRFWTCNCASTHPCGVTIVQGSMKKEKHLGLLFEDGERRTHVSIELTEDFPVQGAVDSDSDESVTPPRQDEVSLLKAQVSAKNRLKSIKRKVPKAVSALAEAALYGAYFGIPQAEKWKHSKMDKPDAKLKKPPNTLETRTGETAKGKQPVRQVNFASNGNANIRGGLTKWDKAAAPVVEDICSLAKGEIQGSGGAFQSGKDVILLHVTTEAGGDTNQRQIMTTLEAFLTETPRRDQRLQLGLMTVSILLGLGATPLMPATWNKTNIACLAPSDTPSGYKRPYIRHSSIQQAISSKASDLAGGSGGHTPSDRAKTSLFALGVLLLELLFGETLEQQPFRAGLLGPGGVPNDITDLCTALQWHKRVEAEFGYGLSDAIYRCLTGAFEPPLDLSRAALVGAVWRDVARPLEEFLSAWQRDPLERGGCEVSAY